MSSPTYVEGRVYLEDIRNGNIYPYEMYLAKDRNFRAIVPNPIKNTAQPEQSSDPTQQQQVTEQEANAFKPAL